MLAECVFGDFDRDLVVFCPTDIGRRHGRQREEVFPHPFRDLAELEFRPLVTAGRRWRHDPHLDGGLAERHLFHLWILGQFRQARDPLHLRANLPHHPLRILDPIGHLEDAKAHPLAGDARDLLDTHDAAAGLLHLLADALLDLLRRGPGVGHAHQRDLQVELRKRLAAHRGEADPADDHHGENQHVHGRRVANRPGNDRFQGVASTNCMPSRGFASWLVTTRSVGSRPLSASLKAIRPPPE